jgi:RHS repeat-associated protein
VADGTGTTSNTYDELGRLLSITSPGSVVVGYRYDRDGNRIKLIYPDTTAVTHAFDKASRLASLTDWANRVTRYTYRPGGSLATATMPNGTQAQYSYDNALRLTELRNWDAARPFTRQLGVAIARLGCIALGTGGATISRHAYTLDNVGNRTGLEEILPQLGPPRAALPVASTSYGYDRLYRLITVTPPGISTSYSYDPVGNRLSMVRGSSTAYTYDRADRILTAGATNYTVNANGNTTGRGSDSFSYDQANRLVSATISGATSTYSYDGDGKRTSKTVAMVTTDYVYDVNGGLPVLLDDGARKYVWGLGLAYTVELGGVLAAYHLDGLGSVRALSSLAGLVTQTYETDEFAVPTASAGASTQPFQYTGEQRDAETSLFYLRARMYDPAAGRFVQRDPAAGYGFLPSTLHRYSYAMNNPLRWSDPSGYIPAKSQVLIQTPTPQPQSGLLPFYPSACAKIEMDIQNLVNELSNRDLELRTDPHGLRFYNWYTRHPWWGSVQGHRQQFMDKQVNLNSKLTEWSDNQCWRNPTQQSTLISPATQWAAAPIPVSPPGGPLIGPPNNPLPSISPPSPTAPFGWDPAGVPWWVYVRLGLTPGGPPEPYRTVPQY